MARYRLEAFVFLGAVASIGFIGLAMYRLSYDVWAGLVIAPVLVLVSLPLIRRILGTPLASIFPLMITGYFLKLVGSGARYYVVFDAYGKNADAERYFDVGSELAAGVRSGRTSIFSVLPLARDTAFIERLTGFVLTFLGPTRLGGFFIFSTLAYLGTVCFVRAAVMGVPQLAARRYAIVCIVAPSLIFWPSSLGKEAWMITCLGAFSLGFAKVLCWQGRAGGLLLIVVSAIGIGVVRPHLAAIFVGSATIGFAFSVMAPPEPITRRRRGSLLGFTVVAVAGLIVSSMAALRYLGEDSQDGQTTGLLGGISSILDRTSGQTAQGGSSFEPIDIDNPARWPYAAARTLTRPFIFEANNLASLLPALEMTLFIGILLVGWRRTINLPRVLRRSPYLMYALFATFLFGLAFAAVGNLGILVRQRAIVVPFLALLLCLPQRPRRTAPPRFTLPPRVMSELPPRDRGRRTTLVR